MLYHMALPFPYCCIYRFFPQILSIIMTSIMIDVFLYMSQG